MNIEQFKKASDLVESIEAVRRNIGNVQNFGLDISSGMTRVNCKEADEELKQVMLKHLLQEESDLLAQLDRI